MALDQQKTIILLVAILLAVVASSVTVLLLLPSGDNTELTDPAVTGTPTPNQTGNFNVQVFDRSDFRSLDQRLIQENSLPVQPPASVGKANPFL